MKKTNLLKAFFAFLFSINTFFSLGKENIFTVDAKRSTIQWVGKKVLGKHEGDIKLISGKLNLTNDNKITSGTFLIDMNTIDCSDLEGEDKIHLIDHLKTDSFFGTQKYSTSTFEITNVVQANAANKYMITGKLTIKGISKPLKFIATILKQGNELVAKAEKIQVNRTQYGIRYGSSSFFSNLGDKAIHDHFELTIHVIATSN